MNKNIVKSLFFILASINPLLLKAQEFSPRAQEILRQSVENEVAPHLRYLNASIFASSPALSGNDDLSSSVDVSSKLSLGFKLGYTYVEESVTARAELSYRNIKFKNESKAGDLIEHSYTNHDIGLSYYVIHQTWERIKLVAGVKFQSLFYSQTKTVPNTVEIKSEVEAIPSVGVEWDAWKSESTVISPYALIGISLPSADVKNGMSTQVGFKFNYAYVPNYTIIGDLSYSEIDNKTEVTQFTIASKQKRSDFNLQLGMQKEF